jgi:sigma-B regulation protein RsbU (phosphoserine phosphatase)
MLGPFPARSYELGLAQLHPGDLLHFYTDGVTEAGAPEADPFGAERLIQVLRAARGGSSESVNQAVLAAVDEHAGIDHPDDDITLMTLQVTA